MGVDPMLCNILFGLVTLTVIVTIPITIKIREDFPFWKIHIAWCIIAEFIAYYLYFVVFR